MLRLRESTNDRCAVLWLYLGFVSLNIPLCLLHKKVLVSRHAYNKLALFKNNNTSHAHLFWTEVLIISSLNEGTIFQTIFLSVFIKILKFITGLINDHLPHFPKNKFWHATITLANKSRYMWRYVHAIAHLLQAGLSSVNMVLELLALIHS